MKNIKNSEECMKYKTTVEQEHRFYKIFEIGRAHV